MTDTTEWTPEKRKIREAQNLAYAEGVHDNGSSWAAAHMAADRRYPPPPPEYTYGREIAPPGGNPFHMVRVRSDGIIEGYDCAQGRWRASPSTKAYIRDLCSEFPLSDAECDAVLDAQWGCSGQCTWSDETRAELRAAFVRVMRGEVKP